MDDNEITARNADKVSPLHFQADGGDLVVHYHQPVEKEVVIKDSGNVGLGTKEPRQKLVVDEGKVGIGYNDAAQTAALAVHGNVGIGTVIPSYGRLQIKADSADAGGGITLYQDSGSTARSYLKPDGGNDFNWHLTRAGSDSRGIVIDKDGNLGIGTKSPGERLTVKALNIGPNPGAFVIESSATTLHLAQIYEGLNNQGTFTLHSNTQATKVLLNAEGKSYLMGGNVGIGTTEPGAKLGVQGDETGIFSAARVGITGYGGEGGYSVPYGTGVVGAGPSYDFYAGGSGANYGAPSSIRWKKNIKPIDHALDKVLSIRGVCFDWDEGHGNNHDIGFIGEEVGLHIPEIVVYEEDKVYTSGMDYSKITPLLLEAIKEQQHDIKNLRSKIENTGLDYAEYFESIKGKEIPEGSSVILEGEKIRTCKKNETPFGIISENPIMLGGVHAEWPNKFLRDEFGNVIMEEYQEEVMAPKKEKVIRERQKVEKKKIEEEVTRVEVVKKGRKYLQQEITETVSHEVEEPVFKEVNLYDTAGKKVIGRHRVPVMETYEEVIDVLDEEGNPVMEGTGEFVTRERPQLNPDYDESKEYVPRDQRPEWNCVGLLGQLPLRKGQPVAPTWVKIKDISEEVELWLVK
jgi:hypothetical protein